MFEPFGTVKSCELLPPTEKTAGHPHRGYGFVEFEVGALFGVLLPWLSVPGVLQ